MKKHEINTLLGNKIRGLREIRGLSQAALAKKCLKSVETISNFERGKTLPSIITLASLAKALDTEVQAFFDFSKKSDRKNKNVQQIECKIQMLSAEEQELLAIFTDSLCKQRKR